MQKIVFTRLIKSIKFMHKQLLICNALKSLKKESNANMTRKLENFNVTFFMNLFP